MYMHVYIYMYIYIYIYTWISTLWHTKSSRWHVTVSCDPARTLSQIFLAGLGEYESEWESESESESESKREIKVLYRGEESI